MICSIGERVLRHTLPQVLSPNTERSIRTLGESLF